MHLRPIFRKKKMFTKGREVFDIEHPNKKNLIRVVLL